MSVEYCHEHHHYYDTDFVEECEYCFRDVCKREEEEENECKCCGVPNTSYKGYCSRACYNYDLE